jgi:hypothetical protein
MPDTAAMTYKGGIILEAMLSRSLVHGDTTPIVLKNGTSAIIDERNIANIAIVAYTFPRGRLRSI